MKSSEMAFPLVSLPRQLACLSIILGVTNTATALLEIGNGGLPPGYTYHPEIQTAYKLYPTELSWSNARLACLSHGARLAVLDTSQKVGFVISELQPSTSVWTGILRDGYLSPWIDVDGGRVSTILPWASCGLFNTDNVFGASCVVLSNKYGGLCNKFCSKRKSYVCEIPGERRSSYSSNQFIN